MISKTLLLALSKMSDIFDMSAMNVGKYQKSYESDLQENPDNAELNNSLAFYYSETWVL